MSHRPEGTDGSDHMFRETVENAYKVLARTRKWSGTAMYLSLFIGIPRGLYHVLGGYLGGLSLNSPALAMLVCHVIGVLFWYLAKTGTSRESFNLVRLSATSHLIWIAMLITSAYKYHQMTEPALHTDTRLYMYLQDAHGISGDSVRHVLHQMDMGFDALSFTFACLIFANLHPYITIQINMKKKAESIEAEAKPSKAPEKKKADKEEPEAKGGAKRRTARL